VDSYGMEYLEKKKNAVMFKDAVVDAEEIFAETQIKA